MRTTLGTTLATALLTLIAANADAQHYDAGHSLEADQHDERVAGVQARSKASVRVRWQDSAGRHDPRVAVKLLGNHEFDEGASELLRLLTGGTHRNGPFLDQRWQGARFPYVSANVLNTSNGKTLLPPYTIKIVDGIPIGVIGAVLK